jgi:hypothetical protein
VLVLTVPILQPFFKVTPVGFAWEWLVIVVLPLTPVSIVEMTKLVRANVTRHMLQGQIRGASDQEL